MKDTNLTSLVFLSSPSPFLPCFSFFSLAGGYITELGTLLSPSVCAQVLQGGTCRDGRQAAGGLWTGGLPDEGCLLESPSPSRHCDLHTHTTAQTGSETETEVVPGSSEPADRTRCCFQNPRVCLTALVSHPIISRPCGAKQPRTLQSIVGHLGAANSQRWGSRGLPDGLQHLQGFKKLVQINWPSGLPLA